jgi:hypothetical protein
MKILNLTQWFINMIKFFDEEQTWTFKLQWILRFNLKALHVTKYSYNRKENQTLTTKEKKT